jgi:predicted metal-dependent phosphoesterase TrpH
MINVKGDLQIHTICSDGKSSAEDVVYEALKKGLRVIAPTDHNTFRGYYLLRNYLENKNISLIVVPGNEVRTDLGDLIILCREPQDDNKIPREAYSLIDYAHDNNCIVYAPHPYDPLRLGVGDNIKRLKIDAVEIFNASAPPWSNRKALREAKDLGIALLANSDAHIPDFIGSAYNIISLEELTVENVLESIIKKMVSPVGKRPSLIAYLKDLYHSIELRFKKSNKSYTQCNI